MSAKKKSNHNNLSTSSNLALFFYLTLPLLLLPAFFRGLFFSIEADFAHIYTALVLGAYCLTRREYLRPSRNIMDYAWAGLIIAYIISNFVAFNQRDAVEGALAIFNFFAVYWLLAKTTGAEKDFKLAFGVMYISGLGVALAGLGTAFGTFHFNGAYDSGLILSTLQYHNAAAIYLVASGIIGFFLTASLENLWLRIVSGGINYVIIITAFGAGSRGAMLVAPVGFLLLIVGLPKQYRFKVFLNLLAILVPFFLTAKQVLSFGQHSQPYHWGWLIAGIAVGACCQFVAEKFLSFTAETRKKVITAVGIVVTLTAIVLVLFMGDKVMPTTIFDRLSYVSLQDVNVKHRFYYYEDALSIIKDYPVFGTGGGGWNSLYPQYQRFLYYTTEVHSNPLKVWVETGTFGFIFYVLLWAGLAVTVIRVVRKAASPEYRAIAWTAAVAAIAICLHSLIDFSLSLGAVAIMMYGLMGVVRGVERLSSGEDTAKAKPIAGPLVIKIAGVGIAAVFLLISSSLSIAAQNEREAISAYRNGDTEKAISLYQNAARFDPFNFNYPMYLSNIYANQAYQQRDSVLMQTALDYGKKAVDLNKKSPPPEWNLAQAYVMSGLPDDGVETAEQALADAPWRQDSYYNLANICLDAADQYVQRHQPDKARTTLLRVAGLPQVIADKVKSGITDRDIWFRGFLEYDSYLKQRVDQANQKLKTLQNTK